MLNKAYVCDTSGKRVLTSLAALPGYALAGVVVGVMDTSLYTWGYFISQCLFIPILMAKGVQDKVHPWLIAGNCLVAVLSYAGHAVMEAIGYPRE